MSTRIIGWLQQSIDEMVGCVLSFADEELLMLIGKLLRNPPFTWSDRTPPTLLIACTLNKGLSLKSMFTDVHTAALEQAAIDD